MRLVFDMTAFPLLTKESAQVIAGMSGQCAENQESTGLFMTDFSDQERARSYLTRLQVMELRGFTQIH